ncbi:MAG: glycosyltransferase family 4 protein [Anaerolineae bacterium]|nr:glycosyltransferase family 4 protein [Anaerolineae bacterium]
MTTNDERLRVMFLQSREAYGGDSKVHGTLMRAFDRQRLKVYAACNYGDGPAKSAAAQALEQIPDLHVRPTNFGPSMYRRAPLAVAKDALLGGAAFGADFARLVRFARREQIDIVHVTADKPRETFYGLFLARLSGARYVVHLHMKIGAWISPLARWAMKHADGYIAVSDFVARSAVEMGYACERIVRIHNAMDLDGWHGDGVDRAALRREFAIGEEQPTIVIVGRLLPWKGQAALIEALALVRAELPGVRLLVVGDDDVSAFSGDGRYSQYLQVLVAELGLEENVIFTGHRSDVPAILAAGDLFAMPTFEEPFGLVFLEAMAMKMPVVAITSGGPAEIIENGATGLLSPPDDPEALAGNIITLLGDPSLRRRMGEAGRHKVETEYTVQRLADSVEAFYRQLLARQA